MENSAFKDLVNKNSSSASGSLSSRAIARKAVEEEFRKKKRKNAGDGSSSSDEERGYQSSFNRKNKKQNQQKETVEGVDDKAIREDLSMRYRDRAKERREGKSATDAFPDGSSNDFLIVPHNKKGLDLALVRKERSKLRTVNDSENSLPTTGTDTNTPDKNDNKKGSVTIPTLDQAKRTLQAFLSAKTKRHDNDNHDGAGTPVVLSNGLVEYLDELLSWRTIDVSSWEGKPARSGDAWNSLQHTKFSMAIDGNPSDRAKSWEIPRQYTLSRGSDSERVASPSVLLPADVMKKLTSIFQYKNVLREKLIETQTFRVGDRTSADRNKETPYQEESDDDMFKD
mmetsp:Transcript_23843/g.56355  ORF Transcript_23843/g.56355 Transcript_23843/m.56355 type:complete len:340 (+) Transcript_23843:64-1083(+)